jgi:hypothetical protein
MGRSYDQLSLEDRFEERLRPPKLAERRWKAEATKQSIESGKGKSGLLRRDAPRNDVGHSSQ